MRTLRLNRGPDFAKRLGDLLQTRAQFTIILLPTESQCYFSTDSPSTRVEINIVCGESCGAAIAEYFKVVKIGEISPDEWRSCLGPQNEEASLSMLRDTLSYLPARLSLDRNNIVILLYLRAIPIEM